MPNSPDVYQARGCLRLLHQGANIIVNEQELLTMLGGIPQLDQPVQLSLLLSPETIQKESIPQLEPRLAQVLEACAYEPISIDLIVQKVGLDTGAVSGALLELELLGLVSQLPGMRYQRYN